MKIPRIIIAGTNSGCGKTTITAGILAALGKKGTRVQPFKTGPDYIDPMFHTFITGRKSRNLDTWMLEEETIKYLLCKNMLESELAVIEGVMGMYDGVGRSSIEGSTAHLAAMTGTPVILAVNGDGMSLSAAAIVKGFAEFDRSVDIAGIILNNVSSKGHFELLKGIIEEKTGIAVIGYLLRDERYELKSRHLGLVPSGEVAGLDEVVDRLAEEVLETVDLEHMLKLADMAPDITCNTLVLEKAVKKPVRLAVAMDKAFSFYYADNLDLLETLGAEICCFSPIKDRKLPDGIKGLFLGGGYPEVFAGELYENTAIREDIRGKIVKGLPTYAECGGFMYLTDGLVDGSGSFFEMAGVYKGVSEMTGRLQRFGYVSIEAEDDNVVSGKGFRIRGHEFHYSKTEINNDVKGCFKVTRTGMDGRETFWESGYRVCNAVAGYTHLHFWSNIEFARRFLKNCENGVKQ